MYSQATLGNKKKALLLKLKNLGFHQLNHQSFSEAVKLIEQEGELLFKQGFPRSQVLLGNAVLTALRSVSIQDAAHPRMYSQATLGNKKKATQPTWLFDGSLLSRSFLCALFMARLLY
jgi:hypothetical protein